MTPTLFCNRMFVACMAVQLCHEPYSSDTENDSQATKQTSFLPEY